MFFIYIYQKEEKEHLKCYIEESSAYEVNQRCENGFWMEGMCNLSYPIDPTQLCSSQDVGATSHQEYEINKLPICNCHHDEYERKSNYFEYHEYNCHIEDDNLEEIFRREIELYDIQTPFQTNPETVELLHEDNSHRIGIGFGKSSVCFCNYRIC